ncbi:MAG: hypothetical protein CBE11_00375 [Rickettsiales bacterium TMED251]|nr:MAG: hypothetical protein CBE11_00375 [Rickettsiales bacterium TMED251]|tara:strand:+ start:1062 stop:1559 length:498 start_codon:yes stop_codon:yes gene_type:complete
MDDSVIKVLRRNGSWQKKAKDETTHNSDMINKKKSFEEDDFILDQKFGVLAQEIKKRMKIKSGSNTNSFENRKTNFDSEKDNNNQELHNAKAKLLPYLLDIQELANQRVSLTDKISNIDDQLKKIRNDIEEVKTKYQIELDNMKKNLDFFDNSLDLLDDIKGDSK